ncbi:hypothetical protein ElyMa_006204600 [Elysia marginata]|uniref:Uncharacterized protein n=1 Tax=Elysia marginata TaxID=1093978 RepID=A0AAV4H4M1_9GAST|nr:hypothetical protein ElyMa_006204600 [Elysia marginata]
MAERYKEVQCSYLDEEASKFKAKIDEFVSQVKSKVQTDQDSQAVNTAILQAVNFLSQQVPSLKGKN